MCPAARPRGGAPDRRRSDSAEGGRGQTGPGRVPRSKDGLLRRADRFAEFQSGRGPLIVARAGCSRSIGRRCLAGGANSASTLSERGDRAVAHMRFIIGFDGVQIVEIVDHRITQIGLGRLAQPRRIGREAARHIRGEAQLLGRRPFGQHAAEPPLRAGSHRLCRVRRSRSARPEPLPTSTQCFSG